MRLGNKIYSLAVIASIGGFLFGFDTAVISGTTEMVKHQFELNEVLEGWYVSSGLVGCVFGVIFAGLLSDYFGRKKSLLISAALFTLSALGCAIAESFSVLIWFRLLGGLGVGVASMLSPIYISEISPPESRGKLTSLYQLAITIGILVAFISNALIQNYVTSVGMESGSHWASLLFAEPWRGMLGAEVFPALIFLILLLNIPESPRWLWAKSRFAEAKHVVNKFKINDFTMLSVSENKVTTNYFAVRGIRIAIFAGAFLAILTQTSGINAIMYYGNSILSKGGADTQMAFWGQVLIGMINVLFTFIAIFSIDKIGRKKLLYIGVTNIIISLFMAGLMFHIDAHPYWKLTFILTFVASFAFSYGPVIWVLLSELFPTQIRGRAMSIAVLALWLANTIVGQMVPWLRTHISESGIFWLFALFCLPTYYIAKQYLPETKGMSLEEIEDYWMKK